MKKPLGCIKKYTDLIFKNLNFILLVYKKKIFFEGVYYERGN
jgi:hypothetical protein